MDNVFAINLQQQRLLLRRLDVVANNIANLSTNGFKSEGVLFDSFVTRPARAQDRPNEITFARDVTSYTNFAQGALTPTGGALDVAFDGDGFFVVEGPNGPLYTRDGSFQLNEEGALVDRQGRSVLDAGGGRIVLPNVGLAPQIDRDGQITIDGGIVGALGRVNFAAPEVLQRVGDNLYAAPDDAAQIAPTGQIRQGFRENANVQGILEITSLINIQRSYESAARAADSANDLRQGAIQRLGRVSQAG
ncbi:MAG TPA: flagellar basal-body rod protein FlgF [Hyphomonadaceae bacterium]|nr:flagellar basal-body rod protein FlgF [Hyphomonadaceae bacterium]